MAVVRIWSFGQKKKYAREEQFQPKREDNSHVFHKYGMSN